MKFNKLAGCLISAILGVTPPGTFAFAQETGSRLDIVKDRGSLRCSGHNGSFLGFAEVDNQGNWQGLDVELCKALATAIFGGYEKRLDIVPISWAQRWPALQSGDIDAVIKVSGWSQSRDTELNLAFSNPYFMGTFQFMVPVDLGAASAADLDGGTICVAAGTSQQRALSSYLQTLGITVEVLAFEKFEELRAAYFGKRCDGIIEWAPSLAIMRTEATNPGEHVILPDSLTLEAESIVVPEGDPKWLDIMNWLISSLFFAEEVGITSENVDEVRTNATDATVQKFLGVSEGYGKRLGLSDDWAYNVIKAVGNYSEIYDRTLGEKSPYALPRGKNALYSDNGVFFPLMID